MNEYEHEPIRGLPEVPPADEQIVWQGEPEFYGLARRVFHVHKVMFYFTLILVASMAAMAGAGESAAAIASAASWQLALALGSLGILYLLAWLYARSTVYTITSQRLVMRFGVAIPMMVNIPWSKIDEANLRSFKDGSGDISLKVQPTRRRMSYWMHWPHVRPWRFSPIEPSLRSLANAAAVADSLAGVLQQKFPESGDSEAADTAAPATQPTAASPDFVSRIHAAGAP